MKKFEIAFPWIIASLGVLYLAWVLIPRTPDPEDYDFAGFGAIPVLHNGRVKPLDTVARSYLTFLTHKQTFKEEIPTGRKDENGEPEVDLVRRPAIRWLLDVMVTAPPWPNKVEHEGAVGHKVFRIENDELLQVLGLKERSGLRYSLKEFMPRINEVMTKAKELEDVEAKNMNLYEVKVVELAKHFLTFRQLVHWDMPQGYPSLGRPAEQWRPLSDYFSAGEAFYAKDPASLGVFQALVAYQMKKPAAFNESVQEVHAFLKTEFPNETQGSNFEMLFNRFEPFHQATVLYLFAILFAASSWLGWSKPLNQAAFWLTVLGFLVHSWAILARMQILGRPPVINLYSSAVFIGWCCVGVCLIIELFYRNSIPLIVGLVLASVTCGIIGHYLALDGDTLEMLQAVLDTNFWLATHVTIITFGYAATYVAGFLGIIYVVFGLATPMLKKDGAPTVARMIYGVVCFATLLSFTGTVLGGIWADQSWGRFWGWDPKENGALLIVIWNALILHARWGGLVKHRGMALLAIAGNIVTTWSWFGTNLLGVGLHAYGFKEGTKWGLIIFSGSQLFIICVGLIPQKFWMSFQKEARPFGPRGGDMPPPRTAISTSS